MLVARLGELIFIKNENLHTISYARYCTDISYAAPTWVNAVLVDDIEQGIQRIREEVKVWLSNELKEQSFVVRFEDFKFQVWYNEVVDNCFSLSAWRSDRKIHLLEA
jgi:hypothetical protein